MKFSSPVDEVVCEVAGADVIPLVRYLKNKVNISEFKLADSIKCEINLTRNMLYRLYDYNLVSFIRKKDKKKGWYIYYWTFNEKRAKDMIGNIKKKKLDKLIERLAREKNTQFFICKNKCMRLDFEQSHDFNFKCPECGSLLDVEDNVKLIEEIEKEIVILKKEIEDLSSVKKPKQVKKAKSVIIKKTKIVKKNKKAKKIVKISKKAKPLKKKR